ncbi:MAG: EAL domain-containing protein [Hyphomicrobiaceae bacterium]
MRITLLVLWCCVGLLLPVLTQSSALAQSLEAIVVGSGDERIEITPKALAFDGQGDGLRVNTAADADGVRRLMSVPAKERASNPSWIVFALRNDGQRAITRWLTAERYDIIGSGVIWPDLDSARIRALTPSVGFVPQKVENERADIFRITVGPGQTVTYVAELATRRAPRVYLWEPLAYELKVRDRRLFNGIMLGITGLLGVFLTAVFAANHKAIFPSAALVAWCVLAYLCVDFGFWHKLLQLRAEDNAVYRAATEAAMAASLSIFLYTFLRLGSWNGFLRMLILVWIVAALALVFVAVLDPHLAATFARLSFAGVGAVGALMTLFLAVRGQDRALSLIPTWILFIVWLFGATTTLTGQLNGELVVSSLVAGLTLIVVLLGFTVTQFAFGSVEPHYGALPSEQNLRSLAIEGSGAAVWDWHARREEIKVSPIVESILGLNAGELSTKVGDFLKYLHPADQERFRVLLWSIQERGGGTLQTDFRLRHADNSYRWFDLEAASVPTADRRTLRCVGLMRDVTDTKRSQSRLMHDAVHDSLTGLPNRELFLDRLSVAISRAAAEKDVLPKLIFIDIEKFKSVNANFGLIVGDSLLLTIAKRLLRHIDAQDTLARVGGDQFAILTMADFSPNRLAQLAEGIRRAIRAPIRIAGHDVVLTSAIGISVYDGQAKATADDNDLLKEAEIAMYRAKRKGADQIEIFRPEMRNERDERAAIEADLRQAMDRGHIKVLFQPIIYLPREELAGFEAIVRWEHPRLGLLDPGEFVSVAEESDLIVKLGTYVLMQSVEQAAKWQRDLPRAEQPLFVSVNVSSRQLFRQDLIQEIRHIIGRSIVPEGVLRLEVTESLVMENPEQAAQTLELLQGAGARLALDDFGSGYSSLTYLQRFPFDTIKIDRDLVQATSNDEQGSTIVRSIVALAHELGKKVVAEGVEMPQDVGFLRSIGCEYAQGFYYGEPMGEREVSELLKIVRKSERKLQRRGFFRTKTVPDRKQLPPPAAASGSGTKTENAPPVTGPSPVPSPPPGTNPATPVPRQPSNPDQQAPAASPKVPAVANGNAPPPQSQSVLQFRVPGMRTRKRAGPPSAEPPPATPLPHSGGGPPPVARTKPTGPSAPASPPPTASNPTANGNGKAQPLRAGKAPPPPQQRPGAPAKAQPGTPAAAQKPPRAPTTARKDGPPPNVAAAQGQQKSAPPAAPRARGAVQQAENGQAKPSAPPPAPPRPEAAQSKNGPSADAASNGGPGVALPDLSNLPPGIAKSLARLAGASDNDLDQLDPPSEPEERKPVEPKH